MSSSLCNLRLAPAAEFSCRASVYRWEERALHLRCFKFPFTSGSLSPWQSQQATSRLSLQALPTFNPCAQGTDLSRTCCSQLPYTLPTPPTARPGLLRGGPWETSSDPQTPCQCPGVPLTGTACSCQAAISVLIGTLAATLVPAATLLTLRC